MWVMRPTFSSKRLAILTGSPRAIMPGEWPAHIDIAAVVGQGGTMPADRLSYGAAESQFSRLFQPHLQAHVMRLRLGGDVSGVQLTQFER